MISLASIAKQYQQSLLEKQGSNMQNIHRYALKQIISCHTSQAGALLYHCDPCNFVTTLFPACGHRHCPACQHSANNDWLDKQRQKLLPVDYYPSIIISLVLRCPPNSALLFGIIKNGLIKQCLKRPKKRWIHFLKGIK